MYRASCSKSETQNLEDEGSLSIELVKMISMVYNCISYQGIAVTFSHSNHIIKHLAVHTTCYIPGILYIYIALCTYRHQKLKEN